MGTAAKLQSIEPTDFETLATSYLRNTKPELRGLIHTGVNDKGAPIKCRVDGVLFVHGSPDYCIQVAYTKTENDLKRKWLGGKKAKGKPEIGDIAKAHEDSKLWRQTHPTAKHKLYLATKNFLANDTELYRDAIAKGKTFDIEIEIVEGSLLVDFLDNNSEGQYLRQELLGIEACRLSESLLKKIARQSLNAHQFTFQIGTDDYREIERTAQTKLRESLTNSHQALICLTGSSGTGKSTLLRQCGEQLNQFGSTCLWTPPDLLAPGISPASLLDGVLRRFHPGLSERAGEDALKLASQLPGGICLLVDDINRVNSPAAALNTLRALCKQVTSEESASSNHGPKLKFVFPRWPSQNVSHFQPNGQAQEDWVNVEIDVFSVEEREALVDALSETASDQLLPAINALSGDPFLCGLFLSYANSSQLHTSLDRAELINQVYRNFLKQTAEEVAQHSQATPGEVIEALDELIELMIETDNPEPFWKTAVARLGKEKSRLLLALGKNNQLGWVDTNREQECWHWKHERLRDALVGYWLARHACPYLLNGQNKEQYRSTLTAPGLAEAWAVSLVFVEKSQRQAALKLLSRHQPLALAEALNLDFFRADAPTRQIIADELQRHLESYETKEDSFISEPRWLVLRRITQIDSDDVLVVTETMQRNFWVNMARFRNGDATSGLAIIQMQSCGDFLPWIRDTLFEKAAEHFATKHKSHTERVRQVLDNAATGKDTIESILILTGYLAWPELAELAWQIWNKLEDAEQLSSLAHLVWSLVRCADASTQDKLTKALLRIQEISDEGAIEGNIHHASERYDQFIEPLKCLERWKITAESAHTIALLAESYDALRETLLTLLRHVDQPVAIESYIKILQGKGGFFLDELEPIGTSQRENRSNSISECTHREKDTRERLWQMVEEEKDENIRQMAFKFWVRNLSLNDLGRLRSIKSTDVLFDLALKGRLSLRDVEASDAVIDKLKTADPALWCLHAVNLYNNQNVADALFEAFEKALKSVFKDRAERLPMYLPAVGVKRLLKEHPLSLAKSYKCLNALWRSDLPEALTFVQTAIQRGFGQKGVNEYFFYAFGFPYTVSRAMLETLDPVLDKFPNKCRCHLAKLAVRNRNVEWALSHSIEWTGLQHELSRLWWSEEEALNVLNEAASAVPHGERAVLGTKDFYDLENGGQRRPLPFSLSALLKTWLEQGAILSKLTVAGMILINTGTGEDSDWWRQFEPEAKSPEYELWARVFYFLRRKRWQAIQKRSV